MVFLRIIPLTIFVALLFLSLKVIEVMQGSEELFISRATAEDKPKEEAKKEESKKEEGKKEEGKGDEAKKEEGKKEEGKKEEGKKEEGEKKEGEKKEECKEAKKSNPNVSDTAGDITNRHFSQVELDLLQNLAKRREELDRWERNVQIKEQALGATEKRIDDKIVQIETMRKDVSELLAQYNAQEDAKIKSLVKIYEAMKPAEAARIFDEMEMPVLLLVIDKMAEKKAAPILAGMDTRKAKQITVDLAAQRRLNTNRLNSPAAGTPAPATATP